MTDLARDGVLDTAKLLTHYSFDLSGSSIEQLLDRWVRSYPSLWLRAAVIEALYQGRYKAVSVEQILALWQRRGQPLQHFNHEFERIVCSRFPKNLMQEPQLEELLPIPSSNSFDELPGPSVVFESRDDSGVISDRTIAVEEVLSQHSGQQEHLHQLPHTAFPESYSDRKLSEDAVTYPAEMASLEPLNAHSTGGMTLLVGTREPMSRHPIDQFVPAPTASDFYTKLKAVALRYDNSGNAASLALAAEPSHRADSQESVN